MAIFPLSAALISLACAAVIARDALRRPRPEKVIWVVAFLAFTVAAGAEAVAVYDAWTPLLVRVFYLTGAVLVVGYLGLGELYLLAPRRMEAIRVAPGGAMLITALGATLVWAAPLDEARLGAEGWRALERGPALIALVALCSGLGTLILVGGALWSAWQLWRRGGEHHRLIGCVLIAVGTLTVASKGTLARTGLPEDAFSIAMTAGVAIIFAGYLQTRRPGTRSLNTPTSEAIPAAILRPQRLWRATGLTGAGTNGTLARDLADRDPPAPRDPAIAFIEERFLPLADDALSELCRVWSVARPDRDCFTREEARRVWALRLRLRPDAQTRFDALPPPLQLQLTLLWDQVLVTAEPAVARGAISFAAPR